MAVQYFESTPLRWGQCIRRWPGVFWTSFGVTAGLSFAMILVALYAFEARKAVYVPALKLVEDVVPQGGYLRFYQFERNGTRVCPEETRRIVFRPIEPGSGPDSARRVRVLDDFTSLNASQPIGSIVELPLPADLSPGEWYYQRYTWFWCGPADYIFGPTYQENRPVPFTIVRGGSPKS